MFIVQRDHSEILWPLSNSTIKPDRSVRKQRRRWPENITECTGLKINETVWITEGRHQRYNVLLTADHFSPCTPAVFRFSWACRF